MVFSSSEKKSIRKDKQLKYYDSAKSGTLELSMSSCKV